MDAQTAQTVIVALIVAAAALFISLDIVHDGMRSLRDAVGDDVAVDEPTMSSLHAEIVPGDWITVDRFVRARYTMVSIFPVLNDFGRYHDYGRTVLPLPVSAPFHCALMMPAQERLAPELRALNASAPTQTRPRPAASTAATGISRAAATFPTNSS